MEYRIVLTKEEGAKLINELKVHMTSYVKDEYTGEQRIRTDKNGTSEKVYKTPVIGTIHRFSSRCKLGSIDNVWFEFKWTEKTSRFEIEFESKVPEKFNGRKNIPGWDILRS